MKYVVALGSNLGDRLENLKGALRSIALIAEVKATSSFYETDPVGGPEQPDYLNAVAILHCNLSPEDLLLQLQQIESEAGRTREVRWGARTLDLDLISASTSSSTSSSTSDMPVIIETALLVLPHPRAHERAFVLQPWLEIEPEAQIIGKGSVKELFAALDAKE
jgi:2-amino-4-hydroxy-6-hydroxymethyldihydropteridine diphosphokinase